MSHALSGGAAVLSALLGLGGLVFGSVTYFKERATLERARDVSSLPDVSQATRGERSVLDGIVSNDNSTLGHDFVAYQARQHAKSTIRVLETRRQPLRIERDKRFVDIVNTTYAFDPWLVRWGHLERETSPPGWTSGSTTAEGLLRGHAILAVGRKTDSEGFEAETIAAGPRAAYLRNLRNQSEWPFAQSWLLVTPFLLAYAVWQGRRISRGS